MPASSPLLAGAPRTMEEQLLVQRTMTASWIVITEQQVLQLRYWSRLAVPEARAAEVTVDPKRWSVVVVADVPEDHQADELLLEGLGRSVTWLLGKGFDLTVRARHPGGWTWRQAGMPAARVRKRLEPGG